jgi:hypothetical protein
MDQRKKDGLCYFCDDKYVPGHKCKKLYRMELVADHDQDDDDSASVAGDEEHSLHALLAFQTPLAADGPVVSVRAYTGVRSPKYRTPKLHVHLGGLKLVALIDTGSSNFIDERVAAHLGLSILPSTGRNIRIGNGDYVWTTGAIPGVPIVVGSLAADERFGINFHTLPLGGYDVILGVEWLGTLGPVLFDFQRQTMSITRADHRILWAGLDGPAEPVSYAMEEPMGDLLQLLLDDYAAVFQEPHGLPPERHHSHLIRLVAGTDAIAVRPYRYAHTEG